MKKLVLCITVVFLMSSISAQIYRSKTFKEAKHQVICTAYSPDGKFMASGGMDNHIYIWDVKTGISFKRIKGLKDFPISMCFSRDSKYLISGGKDNKVTIWDVENMSILRTLKGHKGTVRSVVVSPDNNSIISGGDDGLIIVWDLKTGEVIRKLDGHKKVVNSVDISIDGSKIISGSGDRTIKEWDFKTGQLLKSFNAHTAFIRCVKYSPDGKFIASCGDDKKIQIWDADSNDLVNTILAHKRWVQTLTFSPDGKYLVSGSHDKYLILIDVKTGKILFQSPKQENYILTVSFRPDGKEFVSGTLNSDNINVWDASELAIEALSEDEIKKAAAPKTKASFVWETPKGEMAKSGKSVFKLSFNVKSDNELKKIDYYVNNKLYSTDEEIDFGKPDENGIYNVQKNIFLKEGENSVKIALQNAAGTTESKEKIIIYEHAAKPEITWISHPSEDTKVTTDKTTIELCVKTKQKLFDIFVFVNNKLYAREINLQHTPGATCNTRFKKEVELKHGKNEIKIAATNNAGQSYSSIKTIEFISAEKPSITWVMPIEDVVETYMASYSIGAFVKSETKLGAIGIYINNELKETMNNPESLSLNVQKTISLSEGQNEVKIVALNDAGKTISTAKNIRYTKPTETVVSWIEPNNSKITTFNNTVDIVACIKSSAKPSSIKILRNEAEMKTISDVEFSGENECSVHLTQTLTLQQGLNYFVIQATNPTGTVTSEKRTIIYKQAEKAQIAWLNPTQPNNSTNIPTVDLKACIQSAAEISTIELYKNMQLLESVEDVSIQPGQECSFQFNKSLELAEGSNLFQLKVKNIAGITESQFVNISFKKVDEVVETEATEQNEYKFALIFGNEDYSSFQTGLESEVNVEYAVRDAKEFKEYAMKYLGVPEENIIFKTNARALDMMKALKKMNLYAKNTFGQGEFIFYYAGHGLPDEKTKEPYLMPVDVGGTDIEFAIKLRDVYDKLTEHPSKRVTVFLDACFSGGGRNMGLVAARGVKIKPKDEPLQSNLVVFTSSSGSQSSHPYKEKEHGFFTYFLLEKIKESKGEVTYKEMSDYLKSRVAMTAIRQINKEQHPQTNISPTVQDKWEEWKFNE